MVRNVTARPGKWTTSNIFCITVSWPKHNVRRASYAPQYLDEAEALIGLPAYENSERDLTRQDDFNDIDPAQLGARALLYTNALHILATARNEDRQFSIRRDEEKFDAQAFNDQWARTLTVKGIANIADLYRAEVRPIARQLSMRHSIERFLESKQGRDGLHKHQHPYLESIAKFLQAGSVPVELTDETGKEVTYFSQGATVVAPSGMGKTVLMAHAVKGLGIGEPAEGAKRGEPPLRALIVVPSQELVQQFKGEIGDNTFRRFAPDVTVGGYYAEEKDDKADVVVITRDKFIDDFRDGQLNDEAFDIAMIDEAHHLTGPGFLQTFRQHWKGPVIGFTATPDYSAEKDVRTILPYDIYHGDTVSYIKDGALNAGQLLMFRVDPWAHRHLVPAGVDLENPDQRREVAEDLLDQSVADFVIPMLREGRRGMIFCEYGNWAAHARVLAELLSEAKESGGQPIILPDGKPIRAEAIGDFRRVSRDGSLSPEVIQEYNEGDVHVITTTEMGREGFNADIDFVVTASSISSLLKLKQIIGRGTRLSKRFPTTVYAHFFIAPDSGDIKTRTLYEAFGLERVEQGVRIGPRSVLANNRDIIRTSRLPRHLKKMSAPLHLRPIGEAVAAVNEIEIPDGYIPLGVAAQDSNHTLFGAKRLLSREGFAWVGRSEMVDGERTFVRYYEPAAADFLRNKKKAPVVTAELISISGLAKRLGVSPEFIRGRARDLIAQGSIALVKHTNNKGREYEYLDGRSQAVVEQHIRGIPVANPDDVRAATIARRLGYSDASQFARQVGVPVVYKQLGNSRAFQYVIDKATASRLLQEAPSLPQDSRNLPPRPYKPHIANLADATDMTRADICKLAGLNQGEIHRLMTDEEFAQGQVRQVWSGDGVHRKSDQTLVWSHDVGMKIAERIKARHQSVPPHLVPFTAIVNVVPVTAEAARRYLKQLAPDPEWLALPDAPKTTCYSWEAMRQAQRKYGRSVPFRIDFDRLPQSNDDTDPDRVAYARGVQYLLLPERRLGFNAENLQIAKAMAQKIRQGVA